jgi:hypothetical protein
LSSLIYLLLDGVFGEEVGNGHGMWFKV